MEEREIDHRDESFGHQPALQTSQSSFVLGEEYTQHVDVLRQDDEPPE